MKNISQIFFIYLGVLFFGTVAHADVVITKDGSRLSGSITLIDQATIHLKTSYAGVLKIAQDKVASFETADSVMLRLESGTVASGPVQSAGDDKLEIRAADGITQTKTAQVAASWRLGAEDPEIVRNRRVWHYEASIDIDGETGNTEEFEIGARIAASLKGPNDVFGAYIEYEFSEENKVKSDDRIQIGAGYESFFGGVLGWYFRGEMEKDRIDQIDRRMLGTGGLSYRLINRANQSLIIRTGAGYETTLFSYNTPDDSGATLELALNHIYNFERKSRIVSNLVYIPEFEYFGNYQIKHDSGIEIPFGRNENWKIGMGIENEYESNRAADRELETTYYTRLIYSWD